MREDEFPGEVRLVEVPKTIRLALHAPDETAHGPDVCVDRQRSGLGAYALPAPWSSVAASGSCEARTTILPRLRRNWFIIAVVC